MTAHTANAPPPPTVRIIVAGDRKIPTPTTWLTTIAVAVNASRRSAGVPDPVIEVYRDRPAGQASLLRKAAQKETRAPSCIARGPPEPKTPPAVVTGRPNALDRRYPSLAGSSESRTRTFENPE